MFIAWVAGCVSRINRGMGTVLVFGFCVSVLAQPNRLGQWFWDNFG